MAFIGESNVNSAYPHSFRQKLCFAQDRGKSYKIPHSTSQLSKNILFRKLKGSEGSSMLWFRSAVASVLSQIVDTLLFISIAFYGIFPIADLLVGQMIAKVVLSVLLVPPAIYLMVAIGKRLDARY